MNNGMRTTTAIASLGVGVWLYAASGGAALSVSATDADAARTFAQRTELYVGLRTRVEQPLPSLDSQRSAWSAVLIRRYIASAIRAARPNARLGDIFASPVDEMFRQTIGTAIYDMDLEGLVPEGEVLVDLVVLEPVPEWAFKPIPQPLLARLPDLPAGVEYRIVNAALVLWDAHAEILIDALPSAFASE